jgi:uncharacterized protein (DUF952 family)
MTAIFHILSEGELDVARQRGSHRAPSLDSEGFTHCSYLAQVVRVATLFFRGRRDLVLLELDRGRIPSPVVDERVEEMDASFPHVFGEIPLVAVVRTHPFPCGADGGFRLPANLSESGPAARTRNRTLPVT